jgi:ketosteroid isomerase-like protein
VSGENNGKIAEEAFQDWRDGKAPIVSIFAPDIAWRILSRSAAGGEYKGKEDFIKNFALHFRDRFSRSEPFRPVRIHSLVAEDDRVAVLWDGRGMATDGVPYENTYAFFMRFEQGLVVECTALLDGIPFDELWDRVKPT